MKNATTTTTPLGSRILEALIWESSLLGHKTLDLVRTLVKPGSRFRSLPHVRILLVLSMLVLILNEDVSFSLSLGDDAVVVDNPRIASANAGIFTAPSKMISDALSSSAFAKTALTLMDSKTGLTLIARFDETAKTEQEKLGVDSGVLLAAAIAAGAVESPEEVHDVDFTTNYFGNALTGSYPNAWSSWRAMSLAITASVESNNPTRDDFVRAAAAQFPDAVQAQDRIYEALRFYQL